MKIAQFSTDPNCLRLIGAHQGVSDLAAVTLLKGFPQQERQFFISVLAVLEFDDLRN